ncbi:hypothetical protein ACIQWZ_33305 [Streptomyces sp. NPDC098077]|uniref:hypothetical protein n=1 Tax=Streptomyces sp. NPDC098077 TaxID=3366093 RepID=UPI0038059CCF
MNSRAVRALRPLGRMFLGTAVVSAVYGAVVGPGGDVRLLACREVICWYPVAPWAL